MKQKNKYTIYIIAVICCFITNNINAQWENGPLGGTSFTQPDYTNVVSGLYQPFESAGIGDFKALSPIGHPLSAFEINTNLMSLTPTYAHLGEVFRSDCPDQYSSLWRMFKGSADGTNEYGRLHSYSSTDDNTNYPNSQTGNGYHFTIQSSFAFRDDVSLYGDLRFNTPGPNPAQYNGDYPRMRILGGPLGYVGIGDYNTFKPNSRLHIHEDDLTDAPQDVYEQITNINTGSSIIDGFKIGLKYDAGSGYSIAELRQQESAPMNFLTASLPRVQIYDGSGSALDGDVGIGDYTTFVPQNRLHLHEDDGSVNPLNVYEQFTNISSYTPATTDGFRVGITYNATSTFNDAELIQQQGSQIKFYTDNAILGGPAPYDSPADRLRIDRELRNVPGRGNFNLTRVGITEGGFNNGLASDWAINPRPVSLLHLGQAWVQNAGGHRNWMDVGTFTMAGTDMMYVGLKEQSEINNPLLWNDQMDGIIAWGDNISNPDGSDNLRLVFTTNQTVTFGDPGTVSGLEVVSLLV